MPELYKETTEIAFLSNESSQRDSRTVSNKVKILDLLLAVSVMMHMRTNIFLFLLFIFLDFIFLFFSF